MPTEEAAIPIQPARVSPGALAPAFTLLAARGGEVSLADYAGRAHVILVFLRNAR
ncbi:MAG TPA: hypothetical protein VNL16_00915 [Chloroflexota bacterium]|nr:hypothetical protein [Chloroflexota bacterium]